MKALTVYAFSTENWRRPIDEVRYLMNFNHGLLQRRQHELHEQGVRITFSGRRDWRVPKRVLKQHGRGRRADEVQQQVMTLNIAFNYGGRAEIVDAVARLVADGVPANKVDEKAIRVEALPPRDPRPRPGHPHVGRVPDLELPALGDGLLRTGLHRGAVAGLSPRGPLRRRRGVPAARATIRRARQVRFTRVRRLRAALLHLPVGARANGATELVAPLLIPLVLAVLVAVGVRAQQCDGHHAAHDSTSDDARRRDGAVKEFATTRWCCAPTSRARPTGGGALDQAHGKVRVIAKGVRKRRAVSARRSRPLACVNVDLVAHARRPLRRAPRRAPERLTTLRSSYERINAGYAVVEVVDAIPSDDVADEGIYELWRCGCCSRSTTPSFDPSSCRRPSSSACSPTTAPRRSSTSA